MALAGALDVVAVLIFVAIGRQHHTGGVTAGGMASTSWPFLVGVAGGWVVARTWQHPMAPVPSGVAVWLSCVAVGMVLRVVSGQGTAAAFIAVALGFLGVEVLGWRLVARAVRRGPAPT